MISVTPNQFLVVILAIEKPYPISHNQEMRESKMKNNMINVFGILDNIDPLYSLWILDHSVVIDPPNSAYIRLTTTDPQYSVKTHTLSHTDITDAFSTAYTNGTLVDPAIVMLYGFAHIPYTDADTVLRLATRRI